MIGRVYRTVIGQESQSAAKTLIAITAAADMVVLIERMTMGQSSVDTAETTNAKVQGASAAGTGTANTPTPSQGGDAAATATVITNLSAEPTYTAGEVHAEEPWNVATGWQWTPATDDDYICLSPSGIVGMMLDVAIAAADMSYGMTFREIGG